MLLGGAQSFFVRGVTFITVLHSFVSVVNVNKASRVPYGTCSCDIYTNKRYILRT